MISRRGLQTKFPEDLLAKDIMAAMEILSDVAQLVESKPQGEEERYLTRRQSFACRACVLGSFNLIEAYLNGLAWDTVQDAK